MSDGEPTLWVRLRWRWERIRCAVSGHVVGRTPFCARCQRER